MVRGQAVEARRFSMTGTKGRSGSVWYDDAGSLVKAIVTTRGETLDYELQGRAPRRLQLAMTRFVVLQPHLEDDAPLAPTDVHA